MYILMHIFCLSAGSAPQRRRPVLADLIPQQTLLYMQRPDHRVEGSRFTNSALGRMAHNPDMANFLADWDASRQRAIKKISASSKLSTAFINELYNGRIALALLDVGLNRKNEINTSLVVSIQLASPPDQKMVFAAIRAALSGITPHATAEGVKITIKTVTVREEPIGNHPVMMILQKTIPVRFVVLGDMILLYRAPTRKLLRVMVQNYDNLLMAKSLTRYPLFRSVYRGTEYQPGMSFLYANMNRLYAIFGALRTPRQDRILNVLGLPSAQALGMAGGAFREGYRHTLYLYAPGSRKGLLDTLSFATKAENAALVVPRESSGILAARLDLSRLYFQLPTLVDAVERIFRQGEPTNLAKLAGAQTILGVPAQDLLRTLGDAIILQPGPAGNILRFDSANATAFEATISRMRQNGQPAKFSSLTVKGATGQTYLIHYFNRSGLPLPIAPSYCIYKANPNIRPVIMLATHPQPIKAILRQKTRGTLQESTDYKRVFNGMGGGYGVFIYVRSVESQVRIYDRLLPVLNAVTALPWLRADPGKLPPGIDLKPYLFGTGVGIKNSPAGITFIAYGPLGAAGGASFLVDEFSGTIGMAALQLVNYLTFDGLLDINTSSPFGGGSKHTPPPPGGLPGIGE